MPHKTIWKARPRLHKVIKRGVKNISQPPPSERILLRADEYSDIEAAKALLANPDIGVTQIAHRLGVSPATLYRYIPAARTANFPGV